MARNEAAAVLGGGQRGTVDVRTRLPILRPLANVLLMAGHYTRGDDESAANWDVTPWAELRVEVQSSPVTAATPAKGDTGLPAATGLVVDSFMVNGPSTPGGRVTISGQVRNTSTAPARYVPVTVAGYDERGRVVTFDNDGVDADVIAPGATAPFTVSMTAGTGITVVRFVVYTRGSR
jgi:hypothetical protein